VATESGNETDSAAPPLAAPPAAVPAPASAALRIPNVADQQSPVPAAELNHPYAPRTFVLQGVIQANRDGKPVVLGSVAVMDENGATFTQRFEDLRQLGYGVYLRNACYVEIRHPMGFEGAAICPGSKPPEPSARLAEVRPAATASQATSSSGGVRVTVVPDNEYPARPWR